MNIIQYLDRPLARSRISISLGDSRVWLAILLLLHVLSTSYYFSAGDFWSNPPIISRDYSVHFYNAFAVGKLVTNYGQPWGYDPHFMAGYPIGTAFDVDNRFVETFVLALSIVGLPLAFNLFLGLAFLAFPLVVYLAAHHLGLTPRASIVAVALGLLAWQLDPTLYMMWHVGMIAFVIAAYLSACVLALLYRYLEQPTLRSWLLFLAIAALAVWVHLFTLLLLFIPVLVLYLRYMRELSLRAHLGLYLVGIVVLLAESYWLLPVIRFLPLAAPVISRFPGGLDVLKDDLLDLVFRQANNTPALDSVRWYVWGLAGLGVYLWWRTGQRHLAIVFGATMTLLGAFAYFGMYLPQGRALEPYRNVVSVTLFALYPAATALATPQLWASLSRLRLRSRLVLVLIAGMILLNLLRASIAYYPHVQRLWSTVPVEDRMAGPNDCQKELISWIKTNTTSNSRLLIQDPPTSSLIPYFVGREMIGGPYYPYFIQQGFANIGPKTMFGRGIGDLDEQDLQTFLQTFNVEWIISNRNQGSGAANLRVYLTKLRASFITLRATFCDYTIYQVQTTPSFFLKGSGEVSSTYNLIRVTNASSGPVVLKYHWLDSLKTDPPLQLAPYPILDDPVGFIQVQNGEVHDFTIYNAY